MLRLVELALFLSPFLAFAAWRYFSSEPGPSTRIVIAAACLIIVLAVALIWLGGDRAISPHDAYAPARYEDGHIIAGHGVPK
jgi:hypothetical protein